MDATFVVTNSDKFLIVMMSNGSLYCQPIIPACSAIDGPVYFTIDIPVNHAEVTVMCVCVCVCVRACVCVCARKSAMCKCVCNTCEFVCA